MSLGVALILAVIAGILHWKHRVPRLVCFLLLFTGVGIAIGIAGFLSGFSSLTIFGVGVMVLIALATAVVFWEEAIRLNGMHRVRTPVIALLFGISLMSVGGWVGGSLQKLASTTGEQIDKAVVQSVNTR